MLNKDFYKLRRDFNPNVVPSVDFIPNPDEDKGYNIQENEPYPDPFGVQLPLAKACLLYTSPSPRDQRGSRKTW